MNIAPVASVEESLPVAMTNLSTLKIVVLGARRVGKSAVTVRHLTKRYIGEYRSNIDLLYKQTVTIDDITTEVEILDVSRWQNDDCCIPTEHARWADAFLVVYSVCDRDSFNNAHELLERIGKLKSGYAPATLLGNKRDLEHARQVEVDAGHELALQFGCQFFEVSAADNYLGVSLAFHSLVREARAAKLQRPRKLSMFTVSKMIGAIIGHGKNTAKAGANRLKKRPSLSL